jgi:hypothetical protein
VEVTAAETLSYEITGNDRENQLKVLKILSETQSGPWIDIPKACKAISVDENVFEAMWKSLLLLVPAQKLDASILAILCLAKLNCTCIEISKALGLTVCYVHTIFTNLSLDHMLTPITLETSSESAVATENCDDVARRGLCRVQSKAAAEELLRSKLRSWWSGYAVV